MSLNGSKNRNRHSWQYSGPIVLDPEYNRKAYEKLDSLAMKYAKKQDWSLNKVMK